MSERYSLSELTSKETVQNIVVFIADSVRYDSVPTEVSRIGVKARAIAPSTFTASSVPSLLTGQYPSSHRVWSFDDDLGTLPPLFTGPEEAAFNYDDEFHIQPRILDTPDRKPLSDLKEPFVYVYHDRGGHFPYDRPFADYENMRAFFEDYDDPAELRRMYQRSIKESGKRFVGLVDDLRERGCLEDTLVVYVSDHGEIIGEHGGLFTHAVPMVPELVEVPMVFAGAGLPENEQHEALLSGTDLLPTLFGALNRPVPNETDGSDLWHERPAEGRLVRSEVWKQTRYEYLQSYIAGSVWDRDGGYVCHRESRLHRLVYSLGVHLLKGPHAPLARNLSPIDYLRLLRAHLPALRKYGTPEFSVDTARGALPSFERTPGRVEGEADRERLESLGYLE